MFSSTGRSARYGTWVLAVVYIAALVFGAFNLAGQARVGKLTVYAVAGLTLLAVWAGYFQIAWWRRLRNHTPATPASSDLSDRAASPPAQGPGMRTRLFEPLVTLCLPLIIYAGQVANDAALGHLTSTEVTSAVGTFVFWLILMGCLWNMLRQR